MHVLIVGAGIGGLTLAQILRKQGISFEIFERDDDENARFQGWAIALHTITDQLLAALPDDMPDLRMSIDHLAPLDLSHQFTYYYGGKDGCYGFEDTPETPFFRAERFRLRKWLLFNLTVQWGRKVSQIERDDHGVTVSFADGTSARGDIAVGADGAYSMARQHLIQRPSIEQLHLVPLMAIVGEVDLSDEAFIRQLQLGHSAYNLVNPELGFIGFVGLHHVHPNARSGRFYWMFMQPDTSGDDGVDLSSAVHWLHTSSQQEKLDHVLRNTAKLSPELREIFELTPASGVQKQPHIWRDLELESLPPSRVVLLGDAAHAMTPSRGEGAMHAFIDAMKLAETVSKLNVDDKFRDDCIIRSTIAEYNVEMLKRGTAAVRASRSSYQEAQRRALTGEHFVTGMRTILPKPVVLTVKA